MGSLAETPFIVRKVGNSPLLREGPIPFGHGGRVALSEIADATTVTVLAQRHPLDDDDH